MLKISTTNAILNHEVQKPTQEIKQNSNVLALKTTQALVTVEATLPKVSIDQSQCFDEAGLKSPMSLTYANSDFARQKMLESIGRISEQGNELTMVHLGYDAIASQSYQNAYGQFEYDWNIDFIPKSRPKIDLIEGNLDIKVQEGTVENSTVQSKPEINYNPGKVNFYLKQKNSIQFQYEPDFNKEI